MVDRGSCTFVTKTRNVQNINGHLALIINNNDDPTENILIKDDGTGSDILIPSLLISKKDGDKLKEYLSKNQKNSSSSSDVIISIELIIVK
jgi:extracellular elastinolytic metalloproteinase